VNAATSLLPIAQSYLGVSTQYAALTGSISQTAQQLIGNLNAQGGNFDITPLVTATMNSGVAVVSSIKTLTAQVVGMRTDLATNNAQVQALMRKVAA
jgi:hypothetical protein